MDNNDQTTKPEMGKASSYMITFALVAMLSALLLDMLEVPTIVFGPVSVILGLFASIMFSARLREKVNKKEPEAE